MKTVSNRSSFCSRNRQCGLSLVELMVSIVLGLVITAAVLAVYLTSKRNYIAEEEVARIQENGRFALNLLQREFTMAGFFGGTLEVEDVAPVAVTTDCAAGNWALDPDVPVEFVNDHSGNASPVTGLGTTLTCLDGNVIEEGTDVLSIKRTAGDASLRAGETAPQLGSSADLQWYLRYANYGDQITWSETSPAAIDALAAPDAGLAFWEASTRIFYIRSYSETVGDGIPALCEWTLIEDDMESRCLVEGIEAMHVEFGIDIVVDGVVDRYLAAPSAAEIETALVARVYLLVRSLGEISGYNNTKTYQLGSKAVGARNDGFMRRVFTTTVLIRNAALPVG